MAVAAKADSAILRTRETSPILVCGARTTVDKGVKERSDPAWCHAISAAPFGLIFQPQRLA